MIKYPKMLNYCPLPCTNMRFIFGWPDKNENEDKAREKGSLLKMLQL